MDENLRIDGPEEQRCGNNPEGHPLNGQPVRCCGTWWCNDGNGCTGDEEDCYRIHVRGDRIHPIQQQSRRRVSNWRCENPQHFGCTIDDVGEDCYPKPTYQTNITWTTPTFGRVTAGRWDELGRLIVTTPGPGGPTFLGDQIERDPVWPNRTTPWYDTATMAPAVEERIFGTAPPEGFMTGPPPEYAAADTGGFMNEREAADTAIDILLADEMEGKEGICANCGEPEGDHRDMVDLDDRGGDVTLVCPGALEDANTFFPAEEED